MHSCDEKRGKLKDDLKEKTEGERERERGKKRKRNTKENRVIFYGSLNQTKSKVAIVTVKTMPRKDGKRRGRDRVQRVSWNDSLSVMRARTKESPLYTTECSVYYTNGQWLTSPPIETNTWDVYICTCMYICDEVLTGSTYKGSHMILRVRLILKKV